MKNTNQLWKLLLYGLGAGIFFNILAFFYLPSSSFYRGDYRLSMILLSMISVFFFFVLKKEFITPYGSPLRTVLIFSLSLGICMGLGHFIQATLIDPDWSQHALAIAQERWATRGYSQQAVAGQIEWTNTFHNPFHWALITGLFFTVLSSILGSLITLFLYWKNKWVPTNTEQHFDFQ